MSQATDTATPRRSLRIVLWVLQVLAAAAFFAAGFAKLTAHASMVSLFDQIGVGQWFRVATGALEVLAAVGLLAPRATFYAAGILVVTMVCAVATHLFVVGGTPIPALVLLVALGVIAWFRRPAASVR